MRTRLAGYPQALYPYVRLPGSLIRALAVAVVLSSLLTPTVPPLSAVLAHAADAAALASTITAPEDGSEVRYGDWVVITGTATEATGQKLLGIELSVDGGTTWDLATGREVWSYRWRPSIGGTVTIMSRAIDDSGNRESPAAVVTVTVVGAPLRVLSAAPSAANASISSQITIDFSEAVDPATFGGTIDGAATVPTQVVVDATGTRITVDPGALEYGRTYAVELSGTVTGIAGGSAGSPYAFSFTVESNPRPKRPSTTIALPPGPFYLGQTYTISGRLTGYVWQRDAGNPLELGRGEAGGGDGRPAVHRTALYPLWEQGGDGPWFAYLSPRGGVRNPVLIGPDGTPDSTVRDAPTPASARLAYQPPFDSMGDGHPRIYRLGETWMLFYDMETEAKAAQTIGTWMHGGGYVGVAFSEDGVSWEPYGGPYAYDPASPPAAFPPEGNPILHPEPAYWYEEAAGAKTGEVAVFFKDGLYHLWRTVTSGPDVRVAYDTAPDPRGPWTKQGVAMELGASGLGPHPEVVYDPERALYVMLLVTPRGVSEGQLALYTADSPGGPWRAHPLNPVFEVEPGWEGSRLYRAMLVSLDGQWHMYYSGNTFRSDARIGLAREVPGARRVEVSTDGGASWQQADVGPDGTWSFPWKPSRVGTYAITARVTDDFLQSAPPAPIGVTVGQARCPCNIWSDATTPTTASSADPRPAELGVRFRADVDGYVTGLRFYKGPAITGTHLGNLWTDAGALLATITFTNETASGWQQVTLPRPVPIKAGTAYVASYHTEVGGYAFDQWYFATPREQSGPLRALGGGTDGGSGVYRYGPSGFPSDTYHASNYWVDVVFTAAP